MIDYNPTLEEKESVNKILTDLDMYRRMTQINPLICTCDFCLLGEFIEQPRTLKDKE